MNNEEIKRPSWWPFGSQEESDRHAFLLNGMSDELKVMYNSHVSQLADMSMARWKRHKEEMGNREPYEEGMYELFLKLIEDRIAGGKAIWDAAPQEFREYWAEFRHSYSSNPEKRDE